ncbi:GNAT family N-acetyltransferase [Ekhidna sp.]
MNLDPVNAQAEFNRFLLQEINLDEYRFKFLNDYIQRSIAGQARIYETSVLNISNNGWVLLLHGDMLFIYGENWSPNQIQEINEVFDLNVFTNFTLAGDDELIDQIIDYYQPRNSEVKKRRIFYSTNEINLVENGNTNVVLATMADLNELAIMLQEYYHEEYDGQNDKSIEEMEERVLNYIQNENIFVLRNDDDEIISFCTIVDPDIGILFTKEQHRSNGFGKVILSHCANQLHIENGTVYLMTDRDRLDSNIVCERIGFTPSFYYKMVEINRN